jgi:hypothetical protein
MQRITHHLRRETKIQAVSVYPQALRIRNEGASMAPRTFRWAGAMLSKLSRVGWPRT